MPHLLVRASTFALLLLATGATACGGGDDDHNHDDGNEEEVINTVTLTFTPSGGGANIPCGANTDVIHCQNFAGFGRLCEASFGEVK